MGGCNHQPCREYLAFSTQVSKYVSKAYAELQLANVAFENVLLTELEGKYGTVDNILARLSTSQTALSEVALALNALRKRMEDRCYVDLPPLKSTNLKSLGKSFVQENIVSPAAWDTISSLTEIGGFWTVSSHMQTAVATLTRLSRKLHSEFENLRQATDIGQLNDVLEENRAGNVKRTFAQLYTAWNQFMAEFLASSMLSTHIWYLWTNRETLVDVPRLKIVNQIN